MAEKFTDNTSDLTEEELIRSKVNSRDQYHDNQQVPVVAHGIVISGEASESDDEIESKPVTGIPHSTSDILLSESWSHQSNEESEQNESSRSDDYLKYNTLLHKKLRERNQNLRKNLVDVACQPYQSASKEIHNISQQLIKSQILVQEVTSSLRKITNELFQLEDRVQSIKNGSFLPDIDISAISPIESP